MQIVSSDSAAKVFLRPGFQWDAQDVYLFDIDGTLLRSQDRVHFNSFGSSLERVLGREIPLSGVNLHGNTDTGIIFEACQHAGMSEAEIHAKMGEIQSLMRQYVAAERSQMDLLLMPSVPETLNYLKEKGAVLGVATGNLEEIGWIKMEEAGLREFLRFGGFSDRFAIRHEMIADAIRQAHALTSKEASVCVVGDTPRDIQAARENGIPVIAVATGHYSFEALMEHEPDCCAESMTELLKLTTEPS